MEKPTAPTNAPIRKKIYVVMIGSAPQSSVDTLIFSLDRFKKMVSSDSAKERFETTLRSIQPSIAATDAFIDSVYAEKDPRLSVSMQAHTLIVELSLSKDEFLQYIYNEQVNNIYKHVIAVGAMPAKKMPNETTRRYTAFPVTYQNDKFVKVF